MKELFSALARELAQGRGAVLCGIVSSAGSTPRGPGAHMAVFTDGSCAGTIGGGALEARVRETALALLPGGAGALRTFRLAPTGALDDLGMVCGGEATVYFQCLDPSALPLVQAAAEALARPVRDVWLVTLLREGEGWDMGLYDSVHGLRLPGGAPPPPLRPLPAPPRGGRTHGGAPGPGRVGLPLRRWACGGRAVPPALPGGLSGDHLR